MIKILIDSVQGKSQLLSIKYLKSMKIEKKKGFNLIEDILHVSVYIVVCNIG